MAKLYSLVTGYEMTPEELSVAGERINTLAKLINVREGLSRKDDTLPWKVMNQPIPDDGPAKGAVVTQDELDLMLDDYYQARGWNVEGVPTKAKLQELGLQDYQSIIEGKEALKMVKIHERKFVSADPEKCVGCQICEYACSFTKEKAFNPLKSRIRVVRVNQLANMAVTCRLCEDPACVAACPRDALNAIKRHRQHRFGQGQMQRLRLVHRSLRLRRHDAASRNQSRLRLRHVQRQS